MAWRGERTRLPERRRAGGLSGGPAAPAGGRSVAPNPARIDYTKPQVGPRGERRWNQAKAVLQSAARQRRRRRRRQPIASSPLDGCGCLHPPQRTWLERGRRRGEAAVEEQAPAVAAGRLSVAEGARVVVSILVGR